MTPIDDPRPFSVVLRDWMDRHMLSWDQACAALGDPGDPVHRTTLGRWLDNGQPRHERPFRALMTLVDEGRS